MSESSARFVVERLRENGHTALYAGGCVRDQQLGRTPNDYDVATSALPKQVRKLFRRTLRVGEQFGIVIVLHEKQQVEVATFRADGDYSDGRRPDTVDYTDDPAVDAQRRDFTVNGLFYDPIDDVVHDHVGGQEDIQRGQIRAIGDPARRFDEDRLRILRAPRFAAVLGFEIEPQTAQEACARAPEIETSGVSPERIHTGLGKLLACPGRARGFDLCAELNLLPVILPEVEQIPCVSRALAALDPCASLELAWATVFHGGPPDVADAALIRLRASNKERKAVVALLEGLEPIRNLSQLDLAAQKRLLRGAQDGDLLQLLRVTALARDGDLEPVRYARARLRAYLADPSPAGLHASPLVLGRDLAQAGLRPGPLFGQVLPQVEQAQLLGRVRTQEEALAFALSLAQT